MRSGLDTRTLTAEQWLGVMPECQQRDDATSASSSWLAHTLPDPNWQLRALPF